MTADLGGLEAAATGTVTPVTPTTQLGGVPYRRRKKPEPVIEVQPEPVPKPVAVIEAYCTPIVVGAKTAAVGIITFNAEDDDLQVLLML
jgi:hypothetical protein